eukprot:CAMPEP_0197577306 /NCGR_PEP_ID=MMETSP1326-20131121/1992_1 /TAXON_ID=1155430 /ORGANISM="Genus nov. species nov., Strain RCC2288" /LENGTH=191 /DNA_ID=CAMNT_0043140361 /DNA_START=58 /DNA_END=632 /DNA_ORIENTATION=+
MNHGDMTAMGGDGGGGDGGMSGGGMDHGGGGMKMRGMPVAFEWGTKVTLYNDAWVTESSFQYVVALLGVFALCLLQEGLFYFRTSYTISPGAGTTAGDLTTPILAQGVQGARNEAAHLRDGDVRPEPSYLVSHHAGGDDVQRRAVPHHHPGPQPRALPLEVAAADAYGLHGARNLARGGVVRDLLPRRLAR